MNLYIREIKKKIYNEVVECISKISKPEPLSRIYPVEIEFNQHKYILKIFADTSNKLVALEVVGYIYNPDSCACEYREIRKNSVLSAMMELLLIQCINKI